MTRLPLAADAEKWIPILAGESESRMFYGGELGRVHIGFRHGLDVSCTKIREVPSDVADSGARPVPFKAVIKTCVHETNIRSNDPNVGVWMHRVKELNRDSSSQRGKR